MKPIDRLRFEQNTPPSTPPVGQVDLKFDPNVGTFVQVNADGTEASVGGGGSTTWGAITGTLSGQTDLQSALDDKEDSITAGTTAQYWRGDKSWQTLDKTAVGLSNVENTALSTWTGSANVTTLGTIATGTWNGTTVAVTNGGTGTTDGSITGTGTLTFTAGGASSNVVLAPTGTGVVSSAAVITTTSSSAATSVAGTTGAIRVPNGGLSVAGNSYLQNVFLGAVGSGQIAWTGGSTTLFAPSASNLQLTNGSFNDFGRLMWGGSTSSYPSLKRSTTTLQVRLADDSAYAQIISAGTATNDSAAAGNIGEIVSSLVATGSAVSLTTATPANVTSISLTAGDWDVEGNVNFNATGATITAGSAGINTTSATVPTDGSEAFAGILSTTANTVDTITLPRKRISISATTTVYLVGSRTFSAGTVAAFGGITARRVR